MIYSVYSYDRREYDYFDAPGPSGTHATAPPKPLLASSSSGGVAPESATWKLPLGAKKVGSGAFPRGRIAAAGGALAGLGEIPDSAKLPLALAVLYLAVRFLR